MASLPVFAGEAPAEKQVAKDTDETQPLFDPGQTMAVGSGAPMAADDIYLEMEYPDDPMEKPILAPQVSNRMC